MIKKCSFYVAVFVERSARVSCAKSRVSYATFVLAASLGQSLHAHSKDCIVDKSRCYLLAPTTVCCVYICVMPATVHADQA